MVPVISYYPKYNILDSLISSNNFDQINLFVDLKNIAKVLYMEHFVKYICESKKSLCIDTSIFSSFISFLSFHKKYSIKRNIKINFYIFYESGKSEYHLDIDENYKANRKKNNLYGLSDDKINYFFDVIKRNLILIEKAMKVCPDVYIIHLQNFEADFIPYYLLKNNLVNRDEKTLNLIYSNDHDLYQTLLLDKENFENIPKIYQFIKNWNQSKLIRYGDIISNYTKRNSEINEEIFPVLMSICGDSGDNIKNVKSMGIITTLKIIEEFLNLTGGIDNLLNNAFEGNKIFLSEKTNSKSLQKVIRAENENNLISKNLKLVSFELISRYVNSKDKKDLICENLNKDYIANVKSLSHALNKLNVELESGELEILFEKRKNLKEFESAYFN